MPSHKSCFGSPTLNRSLGCGHLVSSDLGKVDVLIMIGFVGLHPFGRQVKSEIERYVTVFGNYTLLNAVVPFPHQVPSVL
jgi:hypothetical protein